MSSRFELHRFLPYESHYLSVDGVRMHYFDVSEGNPEGKPCIFLLHGNPTWSFYYRNLIASLKSRYRVIAPDWIGMGMSDHSPERHFRASDRMRHLKKLVDELGLKKISLVMHDWGGPIGTGLASRHPELIEKLVYLNTTLTETDCLPEIIKRAARPVPGMFITKYSAQFIRLTTDIGACFRLPRDVREGYFYPYKTVRSRTAIWDFVADIPFSEEHPTWSDLVDMAKGLSGLSSKPVLILWGLRDPCFHQDMLSQVAGHFPQARVVEFPEAGHLVLEDAFKQCEAEIHQFFETGGATACEPQNRPEENNSSTPVYQGSALYEGFARAAAGNASQAATVISRQRNGEVEFRTKSFDELFKLVTRYQRGLSSLGLVAGQKVLMLVPPGDDFLAFSYAVMAQGGVPVFIDPGMGRENLVKCLNDCNAEGIIASPKAQLLRILCPGIFKRARFHISVNKFYGFGGKSSGFLKKYSQAPVPAVQVKGEATALIAFTSGATGTPKGVVFTNEMLSAQLQIFRESFGIESGRKDFPLLAVFSLFNLASGVTSVFPVMDSSRPLSLDPALALKIMREQAVDYSFGSPALWGKLSEHCLKQGLKIPSLRKVFMAGAPVPAMLIERMKNTAPGAEVFTPYGATEALPVTLISGVEILKTVRVPSADGGQGTLVGKPVKGVSLRVVEAVDGSITAGTFRDLPPGQTGEVIVSGRNVSPAYLNRPDATKNSKIQDGSRFWHRMGDVGYLDESGNLYFCGRKIHAVTWNGRTYYSDPVENVFNRHPQVKRTALIAFGPAKEAALAVEPLPGFFPETNEARGRFLEELLKLGQTSPVTEGIKKVFYFHAFPVDPRHNAKIFRERLGEWASGKNKVEVNL